MAQPPIAVSAAHPRRCSPAESVSLPANKRRKLNQSSGDEGSFSSLSSPHQTTRASKDIDSPTRQHPSSGGDSGGSKWFDEANQQVGTGVLGASSFDNDPPFFISRLARSNSGRQTVRDFPHMNNNLNGFDKHDSEKEDLRDVIDDLTVENKKLKQLLKDRKAHQSSQSPDKLFEVRVHGLPSDKKRELEMLLRTFASNLNINEARSYLPSATSSGAHAANVGALATKGAAIANKQQTDSGYASNSNSGQTSAVHSNSGRSKQTVSKESNDRTIKSYLHNIPDGLLPRQSPVMSEEARMSLVVRRLENLFTGRKAAPGEHSQPLQQQEVSRLAAHAEREEDDGGRSSRRAEGPREAHVLPFDTKVNVDTLDSSETSSLDKRSHPVAKSQDSGTTTPEGTKSASSGAQSPDQRPTRPLDLDIERAQIAEENIDYIRHLGLSSPKMTAETNGEDDGWIYLNLLINMAQLHRINVTPAFIRKSIRKLSAKFELSKDGRKVRWKGGKEGTNLCVEAGVLFDDVEKGLLGEPIDLDASVSGSKSKQHATSNAQTSGTRSEDKSSDPMTSASSRQHQHTPNTSLLQSHPSRSKPTSAFDYQPIVFTGKARGFDNLSYLEGSTESQSRQDNSSRCGSNENLYDQGEHADTGPIVFYNNPLFCSDLSGDSVPTNMKRPASDMWKRTLGVEVGAAEFEAVRDPEFSYFQPGLVTPLGKPSLGQFNFDLSPLIEAGEFEQEPLYMEASGIGGVAPQDNFLVDVSVQRLRTDVPHRGSTASSKPGAKLFGYRITSCSKIDMPPSRLPSPSYLYLSLFSSSSDVDDGLSSSESDDLMEERPAAPPAFLTHFSSGSTGPGARAEYASAEMGRDHVFGQAVRAQGAEPGTAGSDLNDFRINDSHVKQPNLVAGSLAATAGNGSEVSLAGESDSLDVEQAGDEMNTEDDLSANN